MRPLEEPRGGSSSSGESAGRSPDDDDGSTWPGRERNESMMHRRRLLILCVSVEAATGLCLLLAPALLGRRLLGVELSAVATVLARRCGVVLLSLCAACWPARLVGDGALRGMLVYNALITVFLGTLWIGRTWWASSCRR